MKINKNLKTAIYILLVLFICLVFIYLSQLPSNRLTFSSIQSGSKVSPVVTKIDLEFSRPLKEDQDWASLITISPSTDLEFRQLGNIIFVNLSNSLKSNTSYKIEVNNKILDIQGSILRETYTIEFFTKASNLLFTKNENSLDSLYLYQLESEISKKIDSFVNIKEYIVSGNDVIYTMQETFDKPTIVKKYDLLTSQITDLIISSKFIYSVNSNIDSKNNGFSFLAREMELDQTSEDFTPEMYFPKAYFYDLETDKYNKIEALEPYSTDMNQFWELPDGNSWLIQTLSYDNIVVTNRPSENILGKYFHFAGVNKAGNRLLFSEGLSSLDQQFPSIALISPKEKLWNSDLSIYAKDPTLAYDGASWVYSSKVKDLEYSDGQFKLQYFVFPGNKKIEFSEKDTSIEIAKISIDSKNISAEAVSNSVLEDKNRELRQYNNAGRSKETDLIILEIKKDSQQTILQPLIRFENSYNAYWF